jgi:hypothetical protein
MSKEAAKGGSFEQAFCDYANRRLGSDRIERRAKNGKNDRGDIAGFYIRGRRTVIECKCCKRAELAEWLKEAERERGNDDAEFGLVVHKRRGCGEKNFGGNFVTMELDTLLAIMAGGRDMLEE